MNSEQCGSKESVVVRSRAPHFSLQVFGVILKTRNKDQNKSAKASNNQDLVVTTRHNSHGTIRTMPAQRENRGPTEMFVAGAPALALATTADTTLPPSNRGGVLTTHTGRQP